MTEKQIRKKTRLINGGIIDKWQKEELQEIIPNVEK